MTPTRYYVRKQATPQKREPRTFSGQGRIAPLHSAHPSRVTFRIDPETLRPVSAPIEQGFSKSPVWQAPLSLGFGRPAQNAAAQP